jgi:hypothetical protein
MLLGAAPPSFAQGLTSAWNGYTGVGDYSRSNGNTASVVNAAHGVRDGNYEEKVGSAPEVDEIYDLVIVGGGFAGLIAAYEFRKARPTGLCLVLDNHPGVLKPGDRVVITTTSGAKHRFRVSSVHDNAIYGEHDSVPFSEITSVQRRDFSATKTSILVVVILGVAGAIAAGLSSASHPNVGL